jgi:4-hydroxythreonine-4-phosphate dehydrogenase
MAPGTERPLAVTAGEPAGIGPDLCLALAQSQHANRIVVIADPEVLERRAAQLGVTVTLEHFDPDSETGGGFAAGRRSALRVLPQSMPNPRACGTPDPANAAALLETLDRAMSGCRNGVFAGMVTGPLQKSVINDAGIPFTGHTEYLATRLGAAWPVMLLVAAKLRVALASTHLPLREVPDWLTAERLTAIIEVLHADLEAKFRLARPRILVCGLNPHAGEQGHLGREEIETIAPVVRRMRDRGLDVHGPLPADTAFTPAAGGADAILAMYHDQGLPVLKYAGFGTAVNVTLGLPIVRTSVDHGTALDIAGTGKADPGSMFAAVELAGQLSGK